MCLLSATEKTDHQDDLQMTNAFQKGIAKEFLK